jgi:hypothetical protein
MPRPRFLHPLTLALLLLLVAVACDENAPTETRAPATPTELGSGGEEPDLAVGDIGAMAIALPVNQSIATTAPAPAFRVNQTGSGPNGIFQITRAGNTQTALQGLTNGRGRAGFFHTTNALNAGPALEVRTNGTGQAGLFQINNTSNAQNAIQASTNGSGGASAVYGVHSGGFGYGGAFELINATEADGRGASAALLARSSSSRGYVARFINQAALGTGPAVLIEQSNGHYALEVRAGPGGAAAHFASSGSAVEVDGNSFFDGNVVIAGEEDPPGPRHLHVSGNVTVGGTLTKSSGSFRIDHPLDPEHKYLSHSFVESPDMKNVYDGTVTLDANGRATVELPEYFEALNRDFRYQLTAIGAPGPNLYIAEGVKQNRFKIAGGRPYASVSWMITGIRQDAYANEHRIKVEEDKPANDKTSVRERLVTLR